MTLRLVEMIAELAKVAKEDANFVKGCSACGRELRFYHLDMTPKPAPAGFVQCAACDQREAVGRLGMRPRQVG